MDMADTTEGQQGVVNLPPLLRLGKCLGFAGLFELSKLEHRLILQYTFASKVYKMKHLVLFKYSTSLFHACRYYGFSAGSGACYFSALQRCCSPGDPALQVDGSTKNVGVGATSYDVNFFITGLGAPQPGNISKKIFLNIAL